MRIQVWHIIVLLLVIVIVFGSNRLPDIASSIGKSMKVFKKEVQELREDTPPSDQDTTGTTPRS
ncbi:MAG: twin-arginine translocase TatA/TatE family subunit [Actinomycetales bacterium]|nr:twin-arginine translocase TatA/TatE family subunit [Actinomycetales bacterium]